MGVIFFFFKQKTAYEIQYGLVGSEMCIRDSINVVKPDEIYDLDMDIYSPCALGATVNDDTLKRCLLYTSDAADERSSVDLGGRRIIKKKKYMTWM